MNERICRCHASWRVIPRWPEKRKKANEKTKASSGELKNVLMDQNRERVLPLRSCLETLPETPIDPKWPEINARSRVELACYRTVFGILPFFVLIAFPRGLLQGAGGFPKTFRF